MKTSGNTCSPTTPPANSKKAYFNLPGGDVLCQGHQGYYMARMLKKHPEEKVLMTVAKVYKKVGEVQTLSEGLQLAAAYLQIHRSNAAGHAVPQNASQLLDSQEAVRTTSTEKKNPLPSVLKPLKPAT